MRLEPALARSLSSVAGWCCRGSNTRGRRALDLLIAATAVAAGLPLYTRNPEDFGALESLLEIVPVELAHI